MSYCRRSEGVVGSKGSFLLISPAEGETQDVGSNGSYKIRITMPGKTRCGRLNLNQPRGCQRRGSSVQVSPVPILPTREAKPRKGSCTELHRSPIGRMVELAHNRPRHVSSIRGVMGANLCFALIEFGKGPMQ